MRRLRGIIPKYRLATAWARAKTEARNTRLSPILPALDTASLYAPENADLMQEWVARRERVASGEVPVDGQDQALPIPGDSFGWIEYPRALREIVAEHRAGKLQESFPAGEQFERREMTKKLSTILAGCLQASPLAVAPEKTTCGLSN